MSNPIVGLDQLYYAPLTADTSEALTYGSAVRIVNVVEANAEIESEEGTFFADDGPAEAFSQISGVTLNLTVADLPPADYAALLGIGATEYGADKVVNLKTSASPIDVAVGYRRQKSNGSYRYIWFMKGKMSVPSENAQTKGESVNFQTQQLTFTFVQTVNNQTLFRRIDSDETIPGNPNEAALSTAWFADPKHVPSE